MEIQTVGLAVPQESQLDRVAPVTQEPGRVAVEGVDGLEAQPTGRAETVP
jgi:hypothetical protein